MIPSSADNIHNLQCNESNYRTIVRVHHNVSLFSHPSFDVVCRSNHISFRNIHLPLYIAPLEGIPVDRIGSSTIVL